MVWDKVGKFIKHHHHKSGTRKIGLNAVPDNGNDAANKSRNIGTKNPVSHSGNNWERDRILLTRCTDDIGEHQNNQDSGNQRDKNLPSGKAERKERASEDIPARTVHI